MKTRRDFFITAAAATGGLLAASRSAEISGAAHAKDDRAFWVERLRRVASPVLQSLAAGTLKVRMPVECPAGKRDDRAKVTHLEAVGRLLCGIAPWLECRDLAAGESELARELAASARKGLANIVDPASPDRIDFTAGGQNLVDAAFLGLGLLRAPGALWTPLDATTKERLIAAMRSTRKFTAPQNNWLLFAATVEAWLAAVGAEWKREPVQKALDAHESWYVGDGTYGDGPEFHWDYYNSFVIQPMLVEVIERMGVHDPKWAALAPKIEQRAERFAAVQERLIAPDGTFPPLGRSLAYRCGAFHHLALMALRDRLPVALSPAQVRGALAAVIGMTLDAAGTFDADGWLRIGLAGHQPGLAESYISTGSLYLCACAFLPLGLPPQHTFWSAPAASWTSRKIWSGENATADHALKAK
jgi:hypothetical protein